VKGNPLTFTDPGGQFSYKQLMVSTGIQSFMGGMISGMVSKMAGGGFWEGFRTGAIGGAVGGAAGFAFAASGAGFGVALVGDAVVDGLLTGVEDYYSHGDFRSALVEGFWGASAALATGGVFHLSGRGLRAMFDLNHHLCNCFVADTMVETPHGPVPIQDIQLGEPVTTRPQDEASSPKRTGTVTALTRSLAPAILWLSLSTGDLLGVTLGHEVWTFQDAWTHAADLEIGDQFLGSDGAPVEVISLALDETPTPVYNLEVDGTFTYFANGVWVHNNSCIPRMHTMRKHGGWPHTLRGLKEVIALQLNFGTSVRWHQALVDRRGRKILGLLPDIQYVRRDGKIGIVEIVATHPPKKSRKKIFMDALGDDFGEYRVIKVEDID
jgi:hypothetical protein